MIRRLLFSFVLFLVACSGNVTSTPISTPNDSTPTPFPDPGRQILLPTPSSNGNQKERVSFYMLLDVSQSTQPFKETRNQIAGFFFTLMRKYSGVSPKVYAFGGPRYGDNFLTPIRGYSEIQELGVSGYGDFYAEAFREALALLLKETSDKRVLVVIAEGSFSEGGTQEQAKILQEVQRTTKELADKDWLYFLIDSNSYEWWQNNLGPLEKTDVLKATGPALYQSIKTITMDIFGEEIQWLLPGERSSIPPTSPRQQLSAVLLKPGDSIEVGFAGGGSEALPGSYEEKNFRQHVYSSEKLPQSLQLSSDSGMGMAAFWIREINPGISDLVVYRKKCDSARCIEIVLKFKSSREIFDYKLQLTADNGEFWMKEGKINASGGGEYFVEWQWKSEIEPQNIRFSVVTGDGKFVFGPVNLVPYPLIYSVKTQEQPRRVDSGDGQRTVKYKVVEMDIWFLSQKDVIKVQGCDIQPQPPPQNVSSPYWELERNTLRVYLLSEQPCKNFSVIFESTPKSINYTCNISDENCQ